MSDLVERLRTWSRGNLSGNALGGPGPMMDEAADEIERLRTENEHLRQTMNNWATQMIPVGPVYTQGPYMGAPVNYAALGLGVSDDKAGSGEGT